MKILTRMGDSSNVELTKDELRTEFEQGSEYAAKKAKVPVAHRERGRLPRRHVRRPHAHLGRAARQRGRDDQGRLRQRAQLLAHVERRGRAGQPRGRRAPLRVDARLRLDGGLAQRLLGEAAALPQGARACCTSSCSWRRRSSRCSTASCPTWGCTTGPDGSFENPSDLMPIGKIDEARETQEDAPARPASTDCIEMSDCMLEMGADGIDFDTVASTGDAEFYGRPPGLRSRRQRDRPAGRDRHVGRDGARLPRPARVQRQAARRHVAAPAAPGLRRGRLRHLRPGLQHQHQEDRCPGTSARR